MRRYGGHGLVQAVVFLRQRIQRIPRQQPVRDRSVKRDRSRALLRDCQELGAHDRDNAALFDEGQQVVPEFLNLKRRKCEDRACGSLRERSECLTANQRVAEDLYNFEIAPEDLGIGDASLRARVLVLKLKELGLPPTPSVTPAATPW